MKENQKRLAVLIDADNTQAGLIEAILTEVANHGIAHVKRIYGDWTSTHMKTWKEHMHSNSLQPMQQFAYTIGKNATDSALIIDAMDLLYADNLDGFCIVSSDSDFTRLSSRLRESGKIVFGFGRKQTPESFTSACDRFFYTENLHGAGDEPQIAAKKITPMKLKQDTRLINSIRKAIDDSNDDDGWSNLGTVGQIVMNAWPQFDARNYGYNKLGELVRAIGLFTVDHRRNEQGSGLYICNRKRRS
ncbi:MAG: NYN domain-containing protein [Salinispira sp.]